MTKTVDACICSKKTTRSRPFMKIIFLSEHSKHIGWLCKGVPRQACSKFQLQAPMKYKAPQMHSSTCQVWVHLGLWWKEMGQGCLLSPLPDFGGSLSVSEVCRNGQKTHWPSRLKRIWALTLKCPIPLRRRAEPGQSWQAKLTNNKWATECMAPMYLCLSFLFY